MHIHQRDDPGPNIGLPLILLASHACDPRLPSARTRVLFGFSACLIVAAVISGAVCIGAGPRRRPPG